MTRAVELRVRIASIDELHGVVTAMRSLAAARIQRAERTLPAIRRYAEIVAGAIARVQSLFTARGAALGEPADVPPRLIVVCSEHGFAGAFNARLLERASAEPEAASGRIWIVGARGLQLARARGMAIEWTLPMAVHVAGVFDTARRLTAEIERRLACGELGRLAILGAHHAPGEGTAIDRRSLLPFASELPHAPLPVLPPLHQLPPVVLLARVIGEYVVAALSRALVESFASENAARLEAMEAARHNIEDKLRALRDQACLLRQEEITTELLDVMTGVAAVREGDA